MPRRPRDEPAASRSSSTSLGLAVLVAVAVLAAVQIWSTLDTRSRLDELEDVSVDLEKAVIEVRAVEQRMAALEEKLGPLGIVGDEWEFIVEDVTRVDSKVSKLVTAFEHQFGVEIENPVQQPAQLDWTQPELFQAARRAAESVGITLTEDEVRVPSKIAIRGGILEYFAVLKGGKEHEALLSLMGNVQPDNRRPADFGAKLNNAIQALGFKRGKPIRFTAGGTKPPMGDPIFLFVEWEEGGEKVVVRAEDLIWNRATDAPMKRGQWVYVGSSFVPGDAPGEALFAADLTAEVVATYSAVNTIIDNTSDGAADDTVFIAATPRIPEDVKIVTFVIRREDREATKTFDAVSPLEREDEDE